MDRLIKREKQNASSKIDPLSCVKILDALEKLPKWDGKQTIAFFRVFMILTTHDSVNELMMNMELNMRCLTTNHDKYDLSTFSKKDNRTINRFKRLIYQGLNLGIHYFPETSLPFNLSEMYRNMRDLYEMKYTPPRKYNHLGTRDSKIRVGYLSADINNNAVNLFMYPMFNNFSDKFDVYIYYNNDKNDDISNCIRKKFNKELGKERWFDVDKLNVPDLNRLIREHEIDVLFDLSVHCIGTRTDVLEKRPCRKIVNFCGYPSTSGLPFHTHRIVDAITDPDGTETTYEHYTEKLMRMEKCFLCFKPFIAPSEIKYLPVSRTLNIGVLNKFEKINQPVMLNLLSTLAKDNPDVVFYFPIGKKRNHYYIKQVIPERQCRFLCDKYEIDDYYSQINLFDLAIDTTPYSGTTTTSSTLFMGLVPFTIYRANAKHVSNVSTSIILNTDPELKSHVCQDEEDYVKRINQALVSLRLEKQKDSFLEEETERRKVIREKFLRANDPVDYIRRFEKVIMDIYNDDKTN